MSSGSPQNPNPPSTVEGAGNATDSVRTPSAIPFSAPSAIPFNAPATSTIPYSTSPAPVFDGQQSIETPVLPPPGSYAQAGATPGYNQLVYGQPAPPSSAYGQQPYGQSGAGQFGQQSGGFRPMASSTSASASISAAGSSILMVALVGMLLAIVCGLGFGFVSVAAGYRIPYLSLVSGLIIGYAIRYFGAIDETIQGAISAGSTIVSFLIAFGIMYYNGLYMSPLYVIFCVIAVYYAYRTASHE